MNADRTDRDERLVALSTMKKFRVAKGESDIRGWDVVTRDHKKIGDIHELIVDPVSLKVRYLDIALDRKLLETRDKTHILVPIAGATLDDDDNRVYIDNISAAEIEAIPPYDHRPIVREYEMMLINAFNRTDSAAASPTVSESAEFYDRPQFSDRRFWGRRRTGREDRGYFEPDEEMPPPDRDLPR